MGGMTRSSIFGSTNFFYGQRQKDDESELEVNHVLYWGADKSLAWPGRKQATMTEDFEFHISYL